MNSNLYELSFPQKNIFMREQFYSGTAINNLSFTFFIKDNLNISVLQKVLNKIVKVNEIIRVQIKNTEDGVFQYITPFKNAAFEVKQMPNSTIDEAREDMIHDAQIPFIFENSKLYKIIIYKIKNNETAIYFKFHHIISDAWTTSIIYEQFNALYLKYTKQVSDPKFKPTIESNQELIDLSSKDIVKYTNKYSYLRYIDSEQTYLDSKNYQTDLEFWKSYVKDIPEPIPFKETVTKKNYISKRSVTKLDFSNEISNFCQENKISPFIFFLTIFSVYFYKTQSKTDFTIGTPLLNRKNRLEKNTVGMYVSTIPLKIHVDPNKSFLSLAKSISSTIFKVMRHERFPYEKILNLSHEVNNNTSNLFDMILSFQNLSTKDVTPYKIENFWNYSGAQQTSFEFHITDYNASNNYYINLDYNENYCNNDEIKFVSDRFVNISKEFLNNKDEAISSSSLLDEDENDLVLNKFNKSSNFTPSKTLFELFLESVKKYPSKIALKYENDELTYKELNDRVNILAKYLLDNGAKPKDAVSLLIHRSLNMVISMLAVLRIGAYYITIDPYWPTDRINYIAENSKSKLLITHRRYVEFHPEVKCLCVEDIDYSKRLDNDSFKKITSIKSNLNDYIYAIYTSGSTGKPKGTMMTNTNIANLLNSTYENFNQDSDDIWTLFHTYTFDFSQWETYGCLTHGGKLIVVPKETTLNPSALIDLIESEKVTILNQTPAYFYKVIEKDAATNSRKLETIRLVILGGEAVFAKPIEPFKIKYPNCVIYNGYGPTETTIFAVMNEITREDIDSNNIYIGYPLDNYKIIITDKNLNPLGIGQEGEICIQSISVCSGYFNNPKMTEEKFIPNYNNSKISLYKSGDVGYWDIDGRIKYIGRNDNQVKIRGFRVELEEIEKQLLACEHVTKAVVIPVENSNLTKSLVAFIETKKPNYVDEVLATIKKNLTSYMIPKLYQLEEFPLNFNGKVDRKKLLDSIKVQKEKFIKPKTKLEMEIADCICKIKGLDEISITQDIFQDLSLDSLDVMQLSTDLSKYNLSIQTINNNTTIEKLAKAILSQAHDINYFSDFSDTKVINKTVDFDLSNTFITGGTGFLGMHILKELLVNKNVNNLYVLIRSKGNIDTEKRFNKLLDYYFGDLKHFDVAKYSSKIHIIEGDFELPFLGLTYDDYQNICEKITTIIHCGANVSHYGIFDKFYKTNVIGTENIIKLAYDSTAPLAHISTCSVGGFCKADNPKYLDENTINISQQFNNHVYMITKYEAECKVLNAISKNQINAKIFRLGNIMPRLKDGRFQINGRNNAFLARMKTISDICACPESFKDYKFDLSPVDKCANSIVRLLRLKDNQTIYHIVNPNTVETYKIFKCKSIKYVNDKTAIELIKSNNNPYNAILLGDMQNKGYIETPTKNDFTIKKLKKCHFKWNKLNKSYLNKIFYTIEKNN